MSETSPLIDRKNSVKFNTINTDFEGNLERAANDAYEALIDDVDDSDLDEDALWLREQRNLNKTTHWIKRPSLIMIGLTGFLFAFANGSAEASRKIILFKLGCNSIIKDGLHHFCDPSETEILISNLQLATTTISSIFSILLISKIGALSDKYGRKPFLFFIFFTFLISRVFKYYLMSHYDYLKFACIVFADVLVSCSGGLMAFLSLLNCYVSDIAEVHQRSYFIGVSMAFFFAGISIGPISGNLVLSLSKKAKTSKPSDLLTRSDSLDFSAYTNIEDYEFNPLRFELILFFLLVLVSAFILPESRSQKARRKSRTMSVSELPVLQTNETVSITKKVEDFFKSVVKEAIELLKPIKVLYIPLEFKPAHYSMERFQRERISLIVMTIIDCLLTGCAMGMGEVMFLYGILRFNWGSTVLAYYIAVSCASRALVLVGLAPVLNNFVYHKVFKFKLMKRQFDMIDFCNCFGGLIVEVVVFIGYAFAPTTLAFFGFIVLGGLSSLISPTLNSAIVKYYPDSKTGELFGSISFVKNLFNLLIPVALLTTYKYSLRIHYPQLIFIVLSVVMVLCSLAITGVKVLLNLSSSSSPEVLTRSSSFASVPSLREGSSELSHNRTNSMVSFEDPKKITDLHRKNSNISQYRN
ncbi:hypothetical protein CLIB1444_08S01464 [[Candida] jaroonii]|uniref:Uncharacterized protein n=1 Tax=[Candida] jaroonii TaxID=467808 RepID=A0ACA9YB06_9ASCO|nr:hypothetical protein CLIB1444_08S01464 [[Candida] jaroonii]